MVLPQIGAHCAVSTCNVLDFLPFTCKCQKTYCRDHVFPDSHSCTAIRESTSGVSSTGTPLQRCALEGCRKPTLHAFTTDPARESCDKCHGSFCVEHRYPDTHGCTSTNAPEQPKPESTARTLLEKNFGSKLPSAAGGSGSRPKTTSKKPPTNPVKLAQWKKVQLMKLRHRAVPADSKDKVNSPPPDQRLTVNVTCGGEERQFWFRKTVSTGKAIDLLSKHFQLSTSDSLTTTLYDVDPSTDEQTSLRNDTELAKQVEDGAELLLSQSSPE